MEENKTIWVFGYGSLVWKPGFNYSCSKLGYICGYNRRFWQGNIAQRGSSLTPGRVATLVKNKEGKTWGRAFQLREEDHVSSVAYLDNREKTLGGYTSVVTQFYAKESNEVFQVLVYIATPENDHYLGPASLPKIADEVLKAKGLCGHNVEYVLKLAEFFRNHLPEAIDNHLFYLEAYVRSKLKSNNINVLSLMTPIQGENISTSRNDRTAKDSRNKFRTSSSTPETFTSRASSRSLKCVPA